MLSHLQIEATEKLLSVLPPSLDALVMVNSGAEAVENAVKIARAATGRDNIIAFDVRGSEWHHSASTSTRSMQCL